MAEFNLENFEKYLSKNPEKKEGKTWKFKENSGYSEKKFLIEATDYSELGAVSETEKLRFNEEDLTESFFDDCNSLIKKVLKEYLKQEEQEEKSPKNMTTTLIFSPLFKSDFQPTVDAVDKNINFYCRGLNYEGKEIKTIILDAKNARDDVMGHYLVKKCLLEFYIYNEIKKIGETTLSFPYYRLNGFFKGSLTFKALKVREGRNNTLKVEVAENLFNSNIKTLFLPKNNELVKETILSKTKSQERNDKETGADFLETDWSEIEGKTFTIENIKGEKCYFENDGLVLNEFGELFRGEMMKPKNKRHPEQINTPHKSLNIPSQQQYRTTKEKEQELQQKLVEYKEELQKTKQLLSQKEQVLEKLKENEKEYKKEKQKLSQELIQANQRIKELEESLSQSTQRLRELHDFAKNGSSSSLPRRSPTNSDFKSKLDKIQKEQQELQTKLAAEKKKNKDLTQQIEQLTNNANSVSLWQKVKKPVIIGAIIVGGLLLIILIYKYWKKIF